MNNSILKTFFLSMTILATSANSFANPVTKVEAKLPFSKGLNLSNWLEPAWGIKDANYCAFGKQDFIDIKNLGVEVIRIPTHFETLSLGKPDYIIPDILFEKLDDAINWCEELKMYVIIDFHNDCAQGSKTSPNIEKILSKIWTQIAERYKDRSEYVIYEIMNEPHEIDVKKWATIQGKIIKLIRQIDNKHSIIVGAADWNSAQELLNLPEYDDDNLIYNFHEYSPFLFTHQGASWTDISRITHIPFPYVKEKMPPLPKNPKDSEIWRLQNYEKDSSEEVLIEPLDKAVEFANKRKAPLMSNEFGVYMKYAEPQERVNWYRIKSGYLDERNIVRISWDYRNSFGIFNTENATRFPQEVNKKIIEAMGYSLPSYKNTTWFDDAKKNQNYTIYKNGVADKLSVFAAVSKTKNENTLYKKENPDDDYYISINDVEKYNNLIFNFREEIDLTELVNKNAYLEFEVKTSDPNFKMNVYFTDSEKDDIPWREGIFLNKNDIKTDGSWNKISFPLNKFIDIGGWNNKEQKWYPSQNKFSWKKIENLVFSADDVPIKKELGLRNIVIKLP